MIVKMKKVSILTLKKDAENTLKRLRNLGILHLTQENTSQKVSELSEVENIKNKISKAVGVLPLGKSKIEKMPIDLKQAVELSDKILNSHETLEKHYSRIKELEKEKDRMAIWGDFDPCDLEYLSEQGVNLNLAIISKIY